MGGKYTKFKRLSGKYIVSNKFKNKTTPAFVLEFMDLLKRNRLKYVTSQYKDVYMGEAVFVIEEISKVEFCRRRRLNTRLTELNCNVVVYTNMYWQDGYFFGKMFKYDMDLFEYLRTEKICIESLLESLVPTLKAIHACGIYLQDIKPENILIDIYDNHIKFYFADFDYAFMEEDFPLFVHKRPWIRTMHYSPELGKPKTVLEARRNDIYAIAVMVGRIETFYNNGLEYNVFLRPRGGIMDRNFDDKWNLDRDLIYADKCASFIISGLNYERVINRFLFVLKNSVRVEF